MAILSLLTEEQLAVLDQAIELHNRSKAPDFQALRDAADKIGWKLQERLDLLGSLAVRAKAVHSERAAWQNRYLAVSTELAEAIDAAEDWVQDLHEAATHAKAYGDPNGQKALDWFQVGDSAFESKREAESRLHVMALMVAKDLPKGAFGLPADFAQQAEALHKRLTSLDTDQSMMEQIRQFSTIELHGLIDRIGPMLEEMATGAPRLQRKLGYEPPGFSFGVLRAARGPAGMVNRDAAAPLPVLTPAPTPLPVLEPLPNGTT